ncbi:hypothetical protein Syun_027254 [Stephania yunnanensis]|uniref:Uncharacterized protein n=1 Tax=Stephania yunnanensis TaxID=152371 RepID=A0AAP0EKR9_9MAGN
MVTTTPGTLHEAYERSLATETFLSTRTSIIVAAPSPTQLDVRPEVTGGGKYLNSGSQGIKLGVWGLMYLHLLLRIWCQYHLLQYRVISAHHSCRHRQDVALAYIGEEDTDRVRCVKALHSLQVSEEPSSSRMSPTLQTGLLTFSASYPSRRRASSTSRLIRSDKTPQRRCSESFIAQLSLSRRCHSSSLPASLPLAGVLVLADVLDCAAAHRLVASSPSRHPPLRSLTWPDSWFA